MKHFDAAPRRLLIRLDRPGPRHAAPSTVAGRRLLVALVPLVLATVLIAVLTVPRAVGRQQALTAVVTPEAVWSGRLVQLYELRAEAFASGDAQLLRQVYTIDSRQLRADVETVQMLAAQRRTVVGFAPTLLEVVTVSETTTSAVVIVRDEIDAFAIRDASGAEMPVAGRASTRTTLTLQYAHAGWLIANAERALR